MDKHLKNKKLQQPKISNEKMTSFMLEAREQSILMM